MDTLREQFDRLIRQWNRLMFDHAGACVEFYRVAARVSIDGLPQELAGAFCVVVALEEQKAQLEAYMERIERALAAEDELRRMRRVWCQPRQEGILGR